MGCGRVQVGVGMVLTGSKRELTLLRGLISLICKANQGREIERRVSIPGFLGKKEENEY